MTFVMIKVLAFRLQTIGLFDVTKATDSISQIAQKQLVLRLKAAVFSFIEPQDAELHAQAPVTFWCCKYASKSNRKQGISWLRKSDLKIGWNQMAEGHELFKQRAPVTLLKALMLSAGGPDRLPEAVFIIQYQRVWPSLYNSSFHSVERGKLILSPWLLDKWQMISSMSYPPPSASHHRSLLLISLSLFNILSRILTHQKLFWLVDLTTPSGLSWPHNQIWQYFFSFTREDKRRGFV